MITLREMRWIRDADEYHTGQFPHRCGCGKIYLVDEWNDLEYLGITSGVVEGRRFFHDLEMRNCSCGSTLSVYLADGRKP